MFLEGGGFAGSYFGGPYFGQPHVFVETAAPPTEIEETLVNIGTASHFINEVDAEGSIGTGTGSQALVEAISEALVNVGVATFELSDFELDNVTNVGTGTPSQSEALSETNTNGGTNSQSIEDDIHITIVPFSDISTGTWTVDPLYEKVDELYTVAGYPTESIRSGDHPNNDTAVLGLTPSSDPGVDTGHIINIEFFREGSEEIDFTVNLKEGSTLIATRTFADVTETEASPRTEAIALSEVEASAIVDYSNLRIELIANEV